MAAATASGTEAMACLCGGAERLPPWGDLRPKPPEACREQALAALEVLENKGWQDVYIGVRAFVKFPDLLRRLLAVPGRRLRHDDGRVMVARCIENSYLESFKLLVGRVRAGRIYLLWKLRPVDDVLYRVALRHGFRDPYYEDAVVAQSSASLCGPPDPFGRAWDARDAEPYRPATPSQRERSGMYTGFRHAWHRFVHKGGVACYQRWWAVFGHDVTHDAWLLYLLHHSPPPRPPRPRSSGLDPVVSALARLRPRDARPSGGAALRRSAACPDLRVCEEHVVLEGRQGAHHDRELEPVDSSLPAAFAVGERGDRPAERQERHDEGPAGGAKVPADRATVVGVCF